MFYKITSLTKYTLALGLTLGLVQVGTAQIEEEATNPEVIRNADKEQHAEWQEGKGQFPGRPRDMWQLGIGGGSFLISGDVKSQFGWGTSLHFRKSLGYVFSLKAEYMYGQARGLNYQASGSGALPPVAPFPNATGTSVYGSNDIFYANYFIPQFHAVSLQMGFNLNNIKFHKKQNKWSLNLWAGGGSNFYQTFYDALDVNGNKYDFSSVSTGLNPSNIADRRTIRNNIKSLLDGDYESLGQQNTQNQIVIGTDNRAVTLRPFVSIGFSLEYLVTKRLSLAIEHQSYISGDDFLDGKTRKENGSLTSNIDIPHYTSVRLGIHFGKKEKRIQPLWFVNPLIFPTKDIADLKENLGDDMIKDTDGDGVIDLVDTDPNTPDGVPVDTKGNPLDSDGDGVPDFEDKEPFSPMHMGYEIDEDGIAMVPPPFTEDEIVEIGDKHFALKECCNKDEGEPGGNLNDWYLPMINFDTDKYNLRPEAYAQLQHVAMIMKSYPNLKVVAHGHTDNRAGDDYNKMLSYNRAMTAIDYVVNQYDIDRSRFIVKYDGKSNLLIPNTNKDDERFINRRVEFYIAQDGDKSQPRPDGDGGANRKWKY